MLYNNARAIFNLRGKIMNQGQKNILKKIAEIENRLPDGVSLTFAIDNMAELMSKDEWEEFIKGVHLLIKEKYLARHTSKETKNKVPYWLELTKSGKEYCKSLS